MATNPYAEIAENPYAEIAEGGKPSTPTTPEAKPEGAVSRFATSFNEGFGIPESVQRNPAEAVHGVKMAFQHPGLELDSLREMYNSASAAQQELLDRAYTLQHSPGAMNKANGFAMGLYASLPIFGPAIVGALDKWASGDKAGALGSLTSIAMQVGGPKIAEKTAPALTSAAEAVKHPIQTMSDFKAAVAEKIKPVARRVTGVESAAKNAVEKAANDYASDVGANREARLKTAKENLETQRSAKTDIDRTKLKIAEQNKEIEARNAARKKAAEEAETTRSEMAKGVDEQSKQLRGTLDKVEESVGKEANSKFNAVREKVGNVEAPPDALVSTVKNAEETTLEGIPESIKEFRRILNMSETGDELTQLRKDVMLGQGMQGSYDLLSPDRQAVVDKIVKNYGGELKPNEPLTWGKLQALKSRLDTRLRTARRTNMNGDLKRALFQVRDGVVDEMGKMAEAKGASAEWQDARDFWRQYKEDFHEPQGPSGSGSPVAKALDAVDPKNIRAPFLQTQSNIGNRALDILRKYPQHGGTDAASAAERLLSSHKAVTDFEVPSATPKATKKTPEAFPLPESKSLPKQPTPPTVDLDKVAAHELETRSRQLGVWNKRDIGIISSSAIGGVIGHILGLGGTTHGASTLIPVAMMTYEMGSYAGSRLLNSPAFREWLLKTPQAELDVLNKLPGADKINIKNGIAAAVNQAEKSGYLTAVSPQLKAFLGPTARTITSGAMQTGPKTRSLQDKSRELRQANE